MNHNVAPSPAAPDSAAAAALPEPARPRPFVNLLPYQRDDVFADHRFRWNCWARQTGKSFTKSLRRILRGLARRRDQIFLSAGERQSRELLDKAQRHCQLLRIACETAQVNCFSSLTLRRTEIRLPGGVRIIALPANPRTARGYTGDVFLDEFAMHRDDREIWAALFPALLRGDGELDIASTPKGCGNLFHQLRDNPRFAASTVTLPDAVAQGLCVDEAALREAMDDDMLYRQEFLCEFLDESTAFLTYAQIAACADPDLLPVDDVLLLGLESRELFVGVDIGRRRDLTVVWVLAAEPRASDRAIPADSADPHDSACNRMTNPPPSFITVGLFELAGATFTRQENLLAELLALPSVRRCCIDAGGLGMQLAEQAAERFGDHRAHGVTLTPALKAQLAGALRVAVEKRRIRIPNDERIRNDWHGVQRGISASGLLTLEAPRREGSHADRFWAAALALHAAENAIGIANARGQPESYPGTPLLFARSGIW